MSDTAVGMTPSDTRYSTAFHSVAATRLAGASSLTSLPRESVTVTGSPVAAAASLVPPASSVVPQPATNNAAATDRPMITRVVRISLLGYWGEDQAEAARSRTSLKRPIARVWMRPSA